VFCVRVCVYGGREGEKEREGRGINQTNQQNLNLASLNESQHRNNQMNPPPPLPLFLPFTQSRTVPQKFTTLSYDITVTHPSQETSARVSRGGLGGEK